MRKTSLVLALFFVAMLSHKLANAAILADKVTSMPEWPNFFSDLSQDQNEKPEEVPGKGPKTKEAKKSGKIEYFTMYSGYLQFQNTDAKDERSIHYVFMESLNDPKTDPVVIWLNGGPGCSSLEGMLTEVGPFVLNEGQNNFTKELNQYTWLNRSSLLFLESPVGVGFSYDSDRNYSIFTDEQVAEDNFNALQTFYASFPEYSGNDLWITGESYAGVYIPWFAYKILEKNSSIPLKVLMVGNGVANWTTLDLASLYFMEKHAFLSTDLWNLSARACVIDYNSPSCQFVLNEYYQLTSGQNPYSVYTYCYPATNQSYGVYPKKGYKTHHPKTPWLKRGQKEIDEFGRLLEADDLESGTSSSSSSSSSDAASDCSTYSLGYTNYLNREDVKVALHVNTSITFKSCSDIVWDNYVSAPNGSQWIYPLIWDKLRIMLYYGDADSVVPFTDAFMWLPNLNMSIQQTWSNWYVPSGQVGGRIQVYDKLTLVTIRGAGHMVPLYKRAEAQYLFEHFLEDEPFDDEN